MSQLLKFQSKIAKVEKTVKALKKELRQLNCDEITAQVEFFNTIEKINDQLNSIEGEIPTLKYRVKRLILLNEPVPPVK